MKRKGRQYQHTSIHTYGDSKKIPLSWVYQKLHQTMTCTCNSGISTTPPKRDVYLYLRHNINPPKRLGAGNVYPYACSCPSRENIRGLSRGMERYNKSKILSSGVRVLTFSIGESFFFYNPQHTHTYQMSRFYDSNINTRSKILLHYSKTSNRLQVPNNTRFLKGI